MLIGDSVNKGWNDAKVLIKKERATERIPLLIFIIGLILPAWFPILGFTLILLGFGLVFYNINQDSKHREIIGTWFASNGFSDVVLANSPNGECFVVTSTDNFYVCSRTEGNEPSEVRSYSTQDYNVVNSKNSILISKKDGTQQTLFEITPEQRKENRQFNRHFAKAAFNKQAALAYGVQNIQSQSLSNQTFRTK